MVSRVATTLAIALCAASASAATINKRIIGGEDAKNGQVPFIVSILNEKGYQFCGGSLLDGTTVLTAAHCITGAHSVKAGTLLTTVTHNSETGGVDAKVASAKIHPDYTDGNSPQNDIGILKLSTSIKESELISYARLPANGSDPVVNSTATAAGWGTQEAPQYILRGNGVDKLSKVVVRIRSREDCSNLNPRAVVDTIVCAGGDGKNVCRGDSGGPLIDQETGQLIGVASYVLKDATKHYYFCNLSPSVYTRVGSYISFINENLGESGYTVPEPQSPESKRIDIVTNQVELHCTRFMNDADACMAAAPPCIAEAKLDTTADELLRCVDRMQACADQGESGKLNQCIDNAKACVGKEDLILGDLDALAQCARKNLQG